MKQYTIKVTQHRNNSSRCTSGSLAELIQHYKYTLECGQSYQHEKGNKKINTSPKTAKSLIINLNNAVNNSAANGYGGKYYELVD